MDREKIDAYVEEFYPEYDTVILFEDLDNTLIGIGVGQDGKPKSVYDVHKIIDCLVDGGMTEEESWEWFEFNIEGTKFSTTEVIYVNTIKHIEDEMS